MAQDSFDSKWGSMVSAKEEGGTDERSLFVPPGKEPVTQRQLNLFYYFIFIRGILEKIKAKDVIEVGSGRGTMSLYLNTYLDLPVTLLDNSSDAIELAKSEFAQRGREAKTVVEDVLNMSLGDESFDAVISIGLAEHFESVDKLFAEQYRILRPGGVIISLNIPQKFSIQFLNTIMRFFKKLAGSYRESIKKDYYRNTVNADGFKVSAEHAGFRDVSITHVCPFPIYVPVSLKTDKRVTALRKIILKFRKIFQKYPYKTNRFVAQAHFLVGYKP
jgi:ubiquinone/menaquinone biosynthesis C-methylase UbiE